MFSFFRAPKGNDSNGNDLANPYHALTGQPAAQPPSLDDEIRITEMAMLLADTQAQWLEKTLHLLQRLCPPNGALPAAGMAGKAIQGGIQAEIAHATQVAGHYRAKLKTLRESHPNQASKPWAGKVSALDAYHHYTYPLGQLLQALPGDITNQHNLSREEIKMCKSVAALAYDAHETLMEGLVSLGQLQAIAEGHATSATLPAIGKLIAYLTEQARFMALNAADYSTAAENIRVK
jgi:hypothetical protein